jgi:hypothetical protein
MMQRVTAVVVILVGAGAALAQVGAQLPATGSITGGIVTPLNELAATRAAFGGGGGGIADLGLTAGETYQASVRGQTVAAAYTATFPTGRVTSFAFDGAGSYHGEVFASFGDTVEIGETALRLTDNTVRFVVRALLLETGDPTAAPSSDLWTPINAGGNPSIQGRFDVGAGAWTDGLLWSNVLGGIENVSIFSAVFNDGSLLATSQLIANSRTFPEMGAVAVWDGARIVDADGNSSGSGVDEVWMVYDVTYVIPTPGAAAVLGLGAIVAGRRRRPSAGRV